MIYDTADIKDSLAQGDIFVDLPFTQMGLVNMAIYGDDISEYDWRDVLSEGVKDVHILAKVEKRNCILISQNCDASNASDLTFTPLKNFSDVLKGKLPNDECKHDKWVGENLPKWLRENPRYFYLPASGSHPFESKYMVDFRITFTLPREDILQYKELRKCRLNKLAREHFRETISQYYRRYALNEWYPLNKAEVAHYSKSNHLSSDSFYNWQA